MLELKVITPEEHWITNGIQWNNEEIKAAIGLKMQDYRGLQYTEENIKEAKKDRANLNKLKAAIESERKRIKNQCMIPYENFEHQVKEIVALIDEPINLIGAQIKEVDEMKREQKRKDIEELFGNIGFQEFVTLEKIFDTKWLNATVSLSAIEEQMKSKMFQIGSDVLAINQLPEFSFEAMETYKETLDLGRAISEGQRLADIQKRKAVQEEERRRQQQEAERERDAKEKAVVSSTGSLPVSAPEEPVSEELVHTIDFRVTATKAQLDLLKNFLKENNITYGPVPQKGE